jgi:hypothetical protein
MSDSLGYDFVGGPVDPSAQAVDPLTAHNDNILAGNQQRTNADGSTSTVLAGTFGFEDGVRMLPTFYDGKQVGSKEAVARAQENWDQWPVYSSEEEAERAYAETKKTWEPMEPAVDSLGYSFVGDRVQPQPELQEEAIAVQQQGNPVATTQAIIARQDAGGFPQGDRTAPIIPENFESTDLGSYWKTLQNAFGATKRMATGSDRQTPAVEGLPELAVIGVGNFLGKDRFRGLSSKMGGVKKAAALLTAFDPVEAVKILAEGTDGELEVRPDEAGNIILSLDGREAMLNAPGMTTHDWMQLGGITAAMSPSTKLANAPTVLANAVRVGTGAAATQVGIEALQASEGGEFDGGDVLATGVFAGSLQGIMQGMAQTAIPWLKKQMSSSKGQITSEMREAFQAAAVDAGYALDDVTDDLIMKALNSTEAPTTPIEKLAVQGEQEFGIPLTRGQRTGDVEQLGFEDAAQFMGDSAAGKKMTAFQIEQQQAAGKAQGVVEQTVGPDVGGRAGGVVRQGVLDAEKAAQQGVDDAYADVGAATLTPEGMANLMKATRHSVRGVEFDATLPETAKIVDLARGLEKLFKGKGVHGVDMERVELMRRRLNTSIESASQNPADKRQVVAMKRGFDDYLDTAIEQGLFSGDEAIMSQLKNARGMFRDYAKRYLANPVRNKKSGKVRDPDAPGVFLERMVAADPTDKEVVEAVFGAAGINKKTGMAMANKYKEILGPDSEGWNAVRREGLKRIFRYNSHNNDKSLSGTQSLKALDNAMEKGGEIMESLYSTEEIALIRRFLAQVKRTQPDIQRSRQGVSGTPQALAKLAGMGARIGGIFGDPMMLVSAAASSGAKSGMSLRNSAKVGDAIRPFSMAAPVKPGAVVAPLAIGEQARGR